MATPLADLLNGLRDDAGMRGEFERSPGDFLDAHGWGSLDVADLQEACYILADGAPSDDAARWLAGGDALGSADGDAASALVTALTAVAPAAFDLDPADLDDPVGLDDAETDAPETDEPADRAGDADTRSHEQDESTGSASADSQADGMATRDTSPDTVADMRDDVTDDVSGPLIEVDIDLGDQAQSVLDDYSTAPDPTGDARETGDFGDDWDELI